jgi:2-oxoglutarate-Fe(II)-dependent oxygenase superfamily protein
MHPVLDFFLHRLEPRIETDFVEDVDRNLAIHFIEELQVQGKMWSTEDHLRSHNCDQRQAIYLAKKYSKKLFDLYGCDLYVHCLALLKYKIGGWSAVHTDKMDADCSDCVLSAVMYMNADYEGGDIVFPKISKSYHPASGTCISYPSLWPAYDHGVNTVTSGTRYTLAWCFTKNIDRAFKPYLLDP